MDTAQIIPTWVEVISYLPDAVVQQIIDLKTDASSLCWRLGNMVNLIYEISLANKKPFGKMQVAGWLAREIEDERSYSSILKYSQVAQFFPRDIQSLYAELPFCHFQYAMSQADRARDVLDKSIELFYKYNRPPSIRLLRATFEGYASIQAPVPVANAPRPVTPQDDGSNYVIVPDNTSDAPESDLAEIVSLTNRLGRKLETLQGLEPNLSWLVSEIVLKCRTFEQAVCRLHKHEIVVQ